MSASLIPVASVKKIISILGGDNVVRDMTKASGPSLSNWRRKRRFPAYLYKLMTDHLGARGYSAPSWLWSQRDGILNGHGPNKKKRRH